MSIKSFASFARGHSRNTIDAWNEREYSLQISVIHRLLVQLLLKKACVHREICLTEKLRIIWIEIFGRWEISNVNTRAFLLISTLQRCDCKKLFFILGETILSSFGIFIFNDTFDLDVLNFQFSKRSNFSPFQFAKPSDLFQFPLKISFRAFHPIKLCATFPRCFIARFPTS